MRRKASKCLSRSRHLSEPKAVHFVTNRILESVTNIILELASCFRKRCLDGAIHVQSYGFDLSTDAMPMPLKCWHTSEAVSNCPPVLAAAAKDGSDYTRTNLGEDWKSGAQRVGYGPPEHGGDEWEVHQHTRTAAR